MVAVLLSILHTLGVVAKSAWSWIRAQLLMAWTAVKLLGPMVTAVWLRNRLAQLAIVLGVTYFIYRMVRDVIRTAVLVIASGVSVSSILSETSWAGWLLWDGPLQFGALWDEIFTTIGFWAGLRALSFYITRVQWFESTFLRTLGRHLQ